ncbi:hypothetical protein NSK_000759 [Nannochloropsis salina CCMP1776]|uniref:Uncharacterized protein n=1 Tax=Nannochloropsis salina CCMP1776 TaxID=1027361 RepID=A0A4D9DAC6_9STRA|nr:hypothetical protein NSK_000759 [Nannochloropsis salina CCMP1776]|eukprot:TFJ88410.1 hypothetical protein NSK_000759 [Nannochloropsis salina CCMP1776]
MKFATSSLILASAVIISAIGRATAQFPTFDAIGHSTVKPISVKAGGRVTLTTSFLFLETRRRELRELAFADEILYWATTNEDDLPPPEDFLPNTNKNKTKTSHPKSSKHGNSTDVRLVRSRIMPNTWRPKLRSNITGSTNFMSIPTTGLVALEDYKIINKFRIGKRYPSGSVITFYVFVDYGGFPLLEEFLDVYVR